MRDDHPDLLPASPAGAIAEAIARREALRPRTAEELAAAFLLSKRTPSTREAYRRDLTDFQAFLTALGPGMTVLAVTRTVVEAYAEHLARLGARPSTIARRLACLSGLYRRAVYEELMPVNPVDGVERPPVDSDRDLSGLDRRQTMQLLATARERLSIRDSALVHLLVFVGLRVSEAISIDWAALGAARGHHTIAVRRKGGKEKTLVLPPVGHDALELLREQRRLKLAGHDPVGPVFETSGGRRMDRQHAYKVVHRAARLAQLEAEVWPHLLRHGFITHALDAGASLRDVQDAAGHADPRTTRRYDRNRGNLDRSPGYDVARWLALQNMDPDQ